MAVYQDFRVKNGLAVTTTATIEGNTQATSTNTGVLQVTGGAGIGKNLYVGGSLNVSSTSTFSNKLIITDNSNSVSAITGALQVTGGVGIGQDLYVANDLTIGGILYGTVIGSVTTATNIFNGTTGQIPYQTTGTKTSFFGPGTAGQILVSAGTTSTGPVFTNTATIYVGYSLYANTSTNLSGGVAGSIAIQSATGTTAFITIGSSGNILIAGTNTATWASTSTLLVGYSNYSNSILKGTAGQLLYQSGTNSTSFIGPGTAGQILVSAGTTSTGPVFQNTLTLTGSTQAISTNSGALQVAGGVGIGGSVYIGNTLTVLSTLSSTSSVSQNALYVAGGVGIGSSLYVTGPAIFTNNVVFSGSTTNVLSTNTVYTDNIIELHYPNTPGGTWGVNDGKDIGLRFHYYDTQDQNAFLGRNNSDGYLEWLVNTSADGVSNIIGTGGKFRTGSISLTDTTPATDYTTGTLVVAGGVGIGGDLLVNGVIYGTVSVSGTITTATNWYGGVPGALIYQVDKGVTGFVTTGTAGQILVSSGTAAPLYVSTSSIFVGRSVIANTLANGNVGQLLFQSGTNVTSFVGTGTTGQILVSAGTTSTGPVFTNTSSIYVGYATSASLITISNDATSTTPQYITFVSTSSSYTSIKVLTTGLTFTPSTGYLGVGVTTATTTLDVGGGVTISGITNITNSTISVSSTTGALQVAGGVGIGGAIVIRGTGNISGDVAIGGNLTLNGGNASTNQTTFNLINTTATTINFGGAATAINIGANTGVTVIRNITSITNTASAINIVSGALTVAGGVGITKDMYVGGTIYGNLVGSISGSSNTATNVDGGIKGQILIQSNTGTTSFIQTGNTNNLLQYNSSTNTATWASTSSIFVSLAASSIVTGNINGGSSGTVVFQTAANKTSVTAAGTAGDILVSRGVNSLGPLFQNTLTLAGIIAASSTNSGALQVRGGVGIGGDLYVGGIAYGTFNGTVAGIVTTATNIDGGTQGQVPYQSDIGITSFAGPGNSGQVLVSSGASIVGPIFVNPSSLSVGSATTATNLANGAGGSIPYQTAAGKTAFIGIGSGNTGFVLTNNGSSATWQSITSSAVGFATTATNIANGISGQLLIQSGVGKTSFVVTGSTGNLLQYNGTNNTATWVSTSTLTVGNANNSTNILGGTAGQVPYQSAANTTQFTGPGTAGNILVSAGASTSGPVFQNTLTLSGNANATTTMSGALQVVGGVGIGGNLVVGGTIAGTINGTINGTATTATNIANGNTGQLLIQSSVGKTSFVVTGATGNLLQYDGTNNTATWISTTTLYVANSVNAVNATNIAGGAVGSILIQSASGTTGFIPLGTTGFVLTAAGTTATWQSAGNVSAGTAVTSTNIAQGTVGQIPYQTAPGSTNFFGPGTSGTILVSAGTSVTGPVFTSTASIYVGYSLNANTATNIAGGTAGKILFQSNTGTTTFAGPGTAGQILVSAGASSSGPIFQSTLTLASSVVATSTTTGALQVVGGVGIGGDLWVGGSIYGIANINGSITTATNLTIGTAGQVPYNLRPGATSWFGPGTAGDVLVSNGTNGPSYNSSIVLGGNLGVKGGTITTDQPTFNLINTSASTVNFAGSATTISIGSTTGTTTVKGNLVVTGNWTVQGTTTIVDSTVTNITDPILILGGTANNSAASVDDNKDRGIAFRWMTGGSPRTGFFGYQDATGFFTFISSATITNEVAAPDTGSTKGAIDAYLAGGATNSIVYQSAPNVTSFLPSSTAGYLLQTNGTSSPPSWISASGLSSSFATTATNIAAGTAGQLHIQSGGGLTSFVVTGSTGNLLQYNGTNNTATWISTSTLLVGNATNSTNTLGGSTGSVHYQSAPNITAFLAASTSGYVLATQGVGNPPAWIAAPAATQALTIQQVSNATYYPTLVDSNNASATAESLYTTSSFTINPSSGWVGFGVTPTLRLDVAGRGRFLQDVAATSGAIVLRQAASDTEGAFIQWVNNANTVETGWITVDTSRNMKIATASTERVRVLAAGNVGIGYTTTQSGALLAVNGGGYFNGIVTATTFVGSFSGGITGSASQLNTQQANSNAAYYPTFVDSNNASATAETIYTTSSFVINPSTGNVGIGTSSPAAKIEIADQNNAGFKYSQYSDADGTNYRNYRARGTIAAPTAVLSGDRLAAFLSGGYGVTGGFSGVNGGINIFAAENFAGSSAGTYLTLTTTAIGANTGGGGTERMRIDSSGTVCIGYTSQQGGALLAVNGGGYFNGIVTATTFVGSFSGGVTGAATQLNTQQANSNAVYYPTFVDSNNATSTAEIHYTTSSFVINPSNGFHGIGTSSPAYLLDVNGGARVSGTFTATGALSVGTQATAPGGVAGEIRATNEITAYYGSDARLKENITPIEDPIKMLEQIRGVYFDWTDEHINRRGGEDGYFVRKHDIGVIAQEVEAILPEIVATRDDGFKAVKYEKIVPLLIETIKAQQKQIDQIMATLKNLINK